MHIHGNSMTINAASLYSTTQQEKAATQRAANVRKKLLRNASEIEDAATPEEALMIGQWMNSGHSQVQSGEQNFVNDSGRDPDFG
jgi:hypothetical protein